MKPTTVLSFDIEEHYRIEAAAGLPPCPELTKATYSRRVEATTRRLLQLLNDAGCQATFFILGEIAVQHPQLIRALHESGHEIASHGWNHESVRRLTPATFRDDISKSKDALEQVIGASIFGYRAPTFSVMRETAWAIDVLQECGFRYDSSIFPVHHDRYGVPDAPTVPFRCAGPQGGKGLIELPPLTLRSGLANLPLGGGGYFRLLPLALLKAGIWLNRNHHPSVAMLYFHPWEFDHGQPRLALSQLSRWRTYVGISRTSQRLKKLIDATQLTTFRRAIDVVNDLETVQLPGFVLSPDGPIHTAAVA
jgi:polysaccharide deacetylase family protein (PEP-CTERM system associated)